MVQQLRSSALKEEFFHFPHASCQTESKVFYYFRAMAYSTEHVQIKRNASFLVLLFPLVEFVFVNACACNRSIRGVNRSIR